MKLRLNLATTPFQNNRPFLAGAGLLGAVGFVALLILSHSAYQSWRANRDLRQGIAQLQAEIRDSQHQQQALAAFFQTPAARQVIDRSAFLNSMIEQRSFPWTKIFMDLEQTLPPGVRVVSISPRLEGGRVSVKLTVGAVSDESKLKFLKALEDSREFSGIQVKQEKRTELTSAPDRIQLQLEAWYETT
jgi:Tfp pilus assembly protein PilN